MELELTKKEYRRLLDMVYIGNWVLNSMRGEDRFADYDNLESMLFAKAAREGMDVLADEVDGVMIPSKAFVEGGIHEAIIDYENAVFFDILAEELSRRDMEAEQMDPNDTEELLLRMERYMAEFELNGTDNVEVK